MADVQPFRALAYDTGVAGSLDALVAPPYDVIDDDQRRELLGRSPYNACHLILPEVAYDEVRGLIDGWSEAGALTRSDAPRMVGWTQIFRLSDGVERERRTLLAAVKVEPYERRVVRPHERTHAGPKEDRLRLTRAVRTNLSPVFGLYPDPAGAAWAAAGVEGEPDATVVDPEGTVHRFWTIEDPAAHAAVSAALADAWILIADGHHRYETALAYRDERRAEIGEDGPEQPFDRVMMGLTALDDPGLVVLPTHRLLSRWPDSLDGLQPTPMSDLDAMLTALEQSDPSAPAYGLIEPGGVSVLTGDPDPDATPGERLDVAVLERRVLIPGLGADQAKLAHDGLLSYTKDVTDAADRVARGDVAAAVIMRPIPKPDVAAVSDAAETMPQKSTYFFPKLLTGIAFNPLDG